MCKSQISTPISGYKSSEIITASTIDRISLTPIIIYEVQLFSGRLGLCNDMNFGSWFVV